MLFCTTDTTSDRTSTSASTSTGTGISINSTVAATATATTSATGGTSGFTSACATSCRTITIGGGGHCDGASVVEQVPLNVVHNETRGGRGFAYTQREERG